MFQRVPGAKVFATGLEDPFKNRHKLYYKICRVKLWMRSRGVCEIERHY